MTTETSTPEDLSSTPRTAAMTTPDVHSTNSTTYVAEMHGSDGGSALGETP